MPPPRVLLPLLVSLALTAEAAPAGPPRDAVQPPLYVLGSTIHLRKAPSAGAESLEKLLIATECVPLEPVRAQWRKVRCGEKEGYVSASLLGTEKPSVEELRAEALDPKLPLAQRADAALRAATLAPDNDELSKVLGDLFFQRNFELLAGAKKPLTGPELSYFCSADAARCIASNAGFIRNTKRRAETRGQWFVLAVGDAEQISVYRGRFHIDDRDWRVTEVVMERTRFTSTPVMERALFRDDKPDDAESDRLSPRLGQFVLDGASQAILAALPREWWPLGKSPDDGRYKLLNDGCLSTIAPYYGLEFSPDVHGRWFAAILRPGQPLFEERWVSAVSRTERGTTLTLVRSPEDPEPELFEIPKDERYFATLGEALYSSRDSSKALGPRPYDAPCGSFEPAGPSFSGEFQPEKAMVALYGRFDAASRTSRWIPTRLEGQLMVAFTHFMDGLRQLTHPWKWVSWREGEQEKVLFLTETPTAALVQAGHQALIGGGIFSRTGTGWRLDRANRLIFELSAHGRAPDHDITVHVIPRGFIAVLPTDATTDLGGSVGSLKLIRDVEGMEPLFRAGTIPEIRGSRYALECGSGEGKAGKELPQCYAYDSEWKFIPHDDKPLPDLVVTTKGSRMGQGQELEHFHEVRTFSADKRTGWRYSLVSSVPVRK